MSVIDLIEHKMETIFTKINEHDIHFAHYLNSNEIEKHDEIELLKLLASTCKLKTYLISLINDLLEGEQDDIDLISFMNEYEKFFMKEEK